MKLIKYDNQPFSAFSDLERFFENSMLPFSRLGGVFQDEIFGNMASAIRVDLLEDDKDYLARFELPGARKEDISVEIENAILTVSLEEKTEDKESGKSTRQLSRSVSLPDRIQADKIQANYENGLLNVRIPKSEAARTRQITIS